MYILALVTFLASGTYMGKFQGNYADMAACEKDVRLLNEQYKEMLEQNENMRFACFKLAGGA